MRRDPSADGPTRLRPEAPSPLRPSGQTVPHPPEGPRRVESVPGWIEIGQPDLERVDELNAESGLRALRSGTTPTDGFFVRSHFPVPHLSPNSWKLSIDGEVTRPRTWTLAELSRLPQRQVVATLECAGNGRKSFATPAPGELRWGDRAVGTATWEGVPVADLLAEADPSRGSKVVVFTGADRGRTPAGGTRGFARGLACRSTEVASTALVATRMNGQLLSPEHGFPARLVVPGWYGMAWVKWLTRITLRRSAFRGFYQRSRYIYVEEEEGQRRVRPVTRMRVKSLVVSPSEGTRVRRGTELRIHGKAWSGGGPVTRVEVNVGSGWSEAALVRSSDPFAWSTWSFNWTPRTSGPVTIRSRATDRSGATQPDTPRPNTYQYGGNAVRPTVVTVEEPQES